jgi:hypothetical protein
VKQRVRDLQFKFNLIINFELFSHRVDLSNQEINCRQLYFQRLGNEFNVTECEFKSICCKEIQNYNFACGSVGVKLGL